MDPEAFIVAEFMARNIRSAKRISEGLRNWARLALEQVRIVEENKTQAGMFGEQPTLSRKELFERLKNEGQPEQPNVTGGGLVRESRTTEPEPGSGQSDAGQAPASQPGGVEPAGESVERPKTKRAGAASGKADGGEGSAGQGRVSKRTTKAEEVEPELTPTQRAILYQNTRSRLTRALNGDPAPGSDDDTPEDYHALRAELENVAASGQGVKSEIAKSVLEDVDHAIANHEHRKKYEAEREAFSLNAPSKEEILERQRAQELAEKEQARKQAEAETEENARRERKEIAQRSHAAADTFELGQSAEDNLSGQGSLLDGGNAQQKAGKTLDELDKEQRLAAVKRMRAQVQEKTRSQFVDDFIERASQLQEFGGKPKRTAKQIAASRETREDLGAMFEQMPKNTAELRQGLGEYWDSRRKRVNEKAVSETRQEGQVKEKRGSAKAKQEAAGAISTGDKKLDAVLRAAQDEAASSEELQGHLVDFDVLRDEAVLERMRGESGVKVKPGTKIRMDARDARAIVREAAKRKTGLGPVQLQDFANVPRIFEAPGSINRAEDSAIEASRTMDGVRWRVTIKRHRSTQRWHVFNLEKLAPMPGMHREVRFSRSQGKAGEQTEAQRQFKETEEAYGGKAAYEQLKAAGKTKLTYGQWVQVRTPNFKKWFGDWEAAGHREFLEGEAVKKLKGDEFAPDGVPLTEKVPRWYQEQGVSTVAVDGIGDVALDERAVKDSIAHGIGRQKANAFAAVPDVLRKGRIIHREAMRGNSEGGLVYHVAAPISIGDQDFIADVLVKADANASRMYVHEVVLKEKLHDSAFKTGALSTESARTGAEPGAIRSVLQTVYAVNPAEVSKVVDPETGEPLVVYHGSFYEERMDAYKVNPYNPLIFTTDNATVAESYRYMGGKKTGTEIYHFFVNAKNIKTADAAGKDFSSFDVGGRQVNTNSFAIEAREQGYDGALIKNVIDTPTKSFGEIISDVFVVFNPNQIKSATDNTGDFDAGNEDIRFARAWHGTPHRGIEQTGFKLNAIGTGEGAQAYGWGIYFASQKEVAEGYRKKLTVAEDYVDGEPLNTDIPRHMLA